jgi:hypothetical protein
MNITSEIINEWLAGNPTKELFLNRTLGLDNMVWVDVEKSIDITTAELTEMEAQTLNSQYQRDRATAYPSIEDQLDAIYHGGVAGWKADIKAVKDANPKPV